MQRLALAVAISTCVLATPALAGGYYHRHGGYGHYSSPQYVTSVYQGPTYTTSVYVTEDYPWYGYASSYRSRHYRQHSYSREDCDCGGDRYSYSRRW